MPIIFAFEQYENLAKSLSQKSGYALGSLTFHRFPEGESYIKINSDVKNQKVILLCGLENADEKIMALMFFAKTAKEFGALEVALVAPYLGYMRMDKRFNDGEAITSNIFAEFLSKQIDSLITIDPHLHRHKTLEEIYSIPCQTLHATDLIAKWIKENVKKPILIGPDEESEQWVKKVAQKSNAPFVILQKIRRGDFDVEVSFPEIEKYQNHTPILVDDIIATANTMIETVKHLKKLKTKSPICIGVHAIFVGDAFAKLKKSGAKKIVTCNSVNHKSNAIDIEDLLLEAITLKTNK
jgi:ribose-phosphate pyrophosphokinase